ncbi:hypothetical protein ACJRO7_035693 [Eucalyptus globulus]|uniref:Pectinesterase n=1 Tax=Eucalyptus globulus TaxID=34317 RepID=A0ABD3JA69_EUCGL
MESVKSFWGYGKVDPLEDRAFRRRTRRGVIIVAASSPVLLAVIIDAVVGTILKRRSNDASSSSVAPMTLAASIRAVASPNTTDPEQIFKLSVLVAINGDAVDHLNDSVSLMEVNQGQELLSPSTITDMRTWQSTAITDHETCLDALEEANSTRLGNMKLAMRNCTEFTSNSLAIVTKIMNLLAAFNVPIHGRLLGFGGARSDFPSWVSPANRRLLQAVNLRLNLTVAQDGMGNHKTIKDAVEAIPEKSLLRFVIYVKVGVYKENMLLDKSEWNGMMYGNGKIRTIVTGDLNFIDETPAFAVAFRLQSGLFVMYRCAFDAFQDTLYAQMNRQFYRDRDITGIADFIFGNAVTSDPNQNSRISILKCRITPNGNLTAQTYLSRPISPFLSPKGWTKWIINVQPPMTIFYGEYMNNGYHPALTSDQAGKFTVGSFILGNAWLPKTGVAFDPSL